MIMDEIEKEYIYAMRELHSNTIDPRRCKISKSPHTKAQVKRRKKNKLRKKSRKINR